MSHFTLGIDMGTTTVSAVLIDEAGQVRWRTTRRNTAGLSSPDSCDALQSPEILLTTAEKIIEDAKVSGFSFRRIGLTGQMHGILYTDASGMACSPLFTWQDRHGNQPFPGEEETCSRLCRIPTGYGVCTFFYHTRLGKIPPQAQNFCTIADYIGMRLCRRTHPMLHSSMAASLGAFSLARGEWDWDKIAGLSLNASLFPQVVSHPAVLGTDREGREIFIAVGDNQASFAGACPEPERSVLLNIGTGSQLSFRSDTLLELPGLETRPFLFHDYLLVGSALCGGRAFALLESFLRSCSAFVSGSPSPSAYEAIDRFLRENAPPKNPPVVRTQFCGTRETPLAKGSIENLTEENFTPQALIYGFLNGIAEELYDFFRPFSQKARENGFQLIGSGNGLRLNPALQKKCADLFGLPFTLSPYPEEAARGAALCCGWKRPVSSN
jgi:sedoheptulokinase